MSDTGTTKKGNASEYVYASEAEAREGYKQAEKDLKAAGNNAELKAKALADRKRAGAALDMFKYLNDGGKFHNNLIKDRTEKINANKSKISELNKKISASRRKGYIAKAMYEMKASWKSERDVNLYLAKKYPNQKITVTQAELNEIANDATDKKMNINFGGKPGIAYYQAFWKEMDSAKKEKAKLLAENKEHQRNIDMANAVKAAALKYSSEKVKRVGPSGGSGGSTRGGSSSGGNDGKTGQAKEEVLQTDENGNKLIRVTDANGNQSFVVEDKDKNRKSIKDDEIKKTGVKSEDIQEAIKNGDWKTLLSLFLKAIGERDQQAQLGNDGQGNAPAQPTVDEYRDKDNIFKVKKVNGNIASISMQEGNMSFELTNEHFKKVGVDLAKIEEALKSGRYDEASLNLLDVGYKSGVIKRPDPVLEIKGSDIILKDQYFLTGERNKPFVLNEQYLIDKCGMTKSKAEKAMENLRVIAASDKTKQGATQIVAQYFSKESPAPKMPEVQTTYGSPKLNRNPGGKVISITVKDATGKEKELGYKDFAKAYGCSPEEAKKLRKECVRAIKNGGNVDGVLSFVANNSEGKSKFWTKTATKIGTYVVGAAAVGVGVYAATGGFKKKDDNNKETTRSSDEKKYVDAAPAVTTTDISTPTDTNTSTGTNTQPTRSTPTTHSNPVTPFIRGGNTR